MHPWHFVPPRLQGTYAVFEKTMTHVQIRYAVYMYARTIRRRDVGRPKLRHANIRWLKMYMCHPSVLVRVELCRSPMVMRVEFMLTWSLGWRRYTADSMFWFWEPAVRIVILGSP